MSGPRPQPVKSYLTKLLRPGEGVWGVCDGGCCCCMRERERERERIFVFAQKLRASLPGCSRRHVNIQRRGSLVPKTEVTLSRSVASIFIGGFLCSFFTPPSSSSPFLSFVIFFFFLLRACICLVRITNQPTHRHRPPPSPYPCVGSLDAGQVNDTAYVLHR